jgi:hypothetical protein
MERADDERMVEPKVGSIIQSVTASWRFLDLLGRSVVPVGVTGQ